MHTRASESAETIHRKSSENRRCIGSIKQIPQCSSNPPIPPPLISFSSPSHPPPPPPNRPPSPPPPPHPPPSSSALRCQMHLPTQIGVPGSRLLRRNALGSACNPGGQTLNPKPQTLNPKPFLCRHVSQLDLASSWESVSQKKHHLVRVRIHGTYA